MRREEKKEARTTMKFLLCLTGYRVGCKSDNTGEKQDWEYWDRMVLVIDTLS